MGCGTTCIKAIFLAFNFIFWLLGAGVLGVGLWLFFDDDMGDKLEILEFDKEVKLVQIAIYIMMGVGGYMFLTGFFGCCGALRLSQCLLGFYIFFVVIAFAAQLASLILGAYFRQQLEDEAGRQFVTAMHVYKPEQENDAVSKLIDAIQIDLECCGAEKHSEYTVLPKFKAAQMSAPKSCCRPAAGKEAINYFEPANYKQCQTDTGKKAETATQINTKGCKDALIDWAESNIWIIVGVCGGIAFIEVIGIVMATCLCRAIKNREEYKHY